MHKHLTPRSSGFTIVELLIVIVVIAILAAITIVAFNGVQDRARASAAAQSASQAARKVKVWQVDNEAISPTCAQFYTLVTGATNETSCNFNFKDTNYQYVARGNGAYCATTTVGNRSYEVSESISPRVGGCDGHGQGGISAVTNLAMDPRASSLNVPVEGFRWTNGRWAGSAPASASHTSITNASDGPVGISSYIRKTWSAVPSGIGGSGDTGFDNNGTVRQAVNEGETYVFSCYMRGSVNRNYQIGIYQYTPANATFSPARSYGPLVYGPANQWTRVSYVYVVPAGVGRITMTCDSNSSANDGAVNWQVGSTLDGTGIMVTKGSTLYNYADGESTNWAWNGEKNAATSSGPPL